MRKMTKKKQTKFKKLSKGLGNIGKVLNAVETLTKVLVEEGFVKGRRWHTIEWYARKEGKGFYLDEFRVSSIKRDLKGESYMRGFPVWVNPNTEKF